VFTGSVVDMSDEECDCSRIKKLTEDNLKLSAQVKELQEHHLTKAEVEKMFDDAIVKVGSEQYRQLLKEGLKPFLD
jgi:hypothetical protein